MKNFVKKLNSLFEDKKKRYLYMILFMLPFIIAIGIFGYVVFKEAKGLLNLVKDDDAPTSEVAYSIPSKKYVLRDNATEYQIALFEELKELYEQNGDEVQLAESICKNYVADFYTWSNKYGQYDVGGLYYVFTPQRELIYIQARDGIYKYINDYANEYGFADLLQVTNVEASGKKDSTKYLLSIINEDGSTTESEYTSYSVKCTWTYAETSKFNTSKYDTSMNFTVIDNNGRFEIVEASK